MQRAINLAQTLVRWNRCTLAVLALTAVALGTGAVGSGGPILHASPASQTANQPGETILPATPSPRSVPLGAAPPPLLRPSFAPASHERSGSASSAWAYDPTSAYDQKGLGAPRGFSAQTPTELVDPYTGNLILRHVDLYLPGVAGLDLTLTRVYNSKIHRNYAKKTSDPNGMLFVPTSALGLGWSMYLGRLVGAENGGPNHSLPGPRYYERSDGSQHPFFQYSGAGCGNGSSDICYVTKEYANPYRESAGQPWRLATADGLNITFGHTAFDGAAVVHYATEIRDIHGNRIQISYHDNTIPGIAIQSETFRHFIDTITDSANRTISFGYSQVNPNVVRLTSITAVGRTYRYTYANTNPWPQTAAFLEKAQPPNGAPWRYEYAGLNNGDCADNSKRWCELTKITYPAGGTVRYEYDELTFWTHGNPASVRAVSKRTIGGRVIASAEWTYTYNRGNNYSGADHTLITRPDQSQEAYTYFGVGAGSYDPWGSAWKAGALLRKETRAVDGTQLAQETFDWVQSDALSNEIWGDPWIGFDTGIYTPRLREQTIRRGNLTWTVTHTSFNPFNNTPRCSTEEASDGSKRYRLRTYTQRSGVQSDWTFRFFNLLEVESVRYTPFPAANCDPNQASSLQPNTGDELYVQRYDSDGQVQTSETNGVRRDFQHDTNGRLTADILFRGANGTDGYCTSYSSFRYGVAERVGYGAPAPGCGNSVYTVVRAINSDGSIASETNALGHTTNFSYDGLGRTTEIRPPGEAAIQIDYDGSSSAFFTRRRVSQGSYWVEIGYDGFEREISQQNVSGVYTRQEYDGLGRIRFQSLPSSNANSSAGDTITYDGLGRVTAVTHADGSSTSYTYGTDAHTVAFQDENHRTTVYTYRAFAHPDDAWLVRVQLPGEPEPTQDTYRYLVGGHLTEVNYGGRSRSLDYNFAKQVISEYNPEQGWNVYGYDAAGNLRCRARNSSIYCNDGDLENARADVRYTLDALGRVTAVNYYDSQTPAVTFTYDNADNVKTMTDGVGSHSFDYTPSNRLRQRVSTIRGVSYTTGYGYDSQGNLTSITYPSGRVVTYGRDTGNRIDQVRDANATYISAILYHPNGTPRQIRYGNGVVANLTQDSRLRPDRLTASGVLDLNYDYDSVGNLTHLADAIRPANTTTFGYDALDRLEDASGGWGTLHYDYDANGDRIREVLNGVATTYAYGRGNHLVSLSGRVNLVFSYDNYGNASKRGNQTFYSYDAENRMISALASASVAYSYDGQNRRVLSTRSGCNSALVYHYDQEGNRIAESTESGLFLKEYIVADRRVIAEIDLTPVSVTPTAIDFGVVEAGIRATRYLTLTNRSNQVLSLGQPAVDSPFSLGVSFPVQIPVGGSVALPVDFRPNGRDAYRTTLTACESNGIQFAIPISGKGVAAVAEIEPNTFDFGDVAMGAVLTRTLTISSSGDIPLRINGWFDQDPALSVTPDSAATLQPGQTTDVTLIFDSNQACSGPYQGSIEIDSNGLNSGWVSVDANILGLQTAVSDLVFPSLAPGVSHTLSFSVTNRGLMTLNPVYTLSGAPLFSLATPADGISPGQNTTISVTYQPTSTLWSPFGDHATVGISTQNCPVDCATRLHLTGNSGAEIAPGGSSPSIARLGDQLHVASVVISGTVWNPMNELVYARRSSGSGWTRGADPSSGSTDVTQVNLLAAANGRLTLLWEESTQPTQLQLRQQGGSGTWGSLCQVTGRRSGWGPMAADSAGAVWLSWLRNSGGWQTGPVFSAAGACQADQPAPFADASFGWSELNLISNGGLGALHLAGSRNERLQVVTLDPSSGAATTENTPSASVNFNTGPGQAIDPAGGRHLAWSQIQVGQNYDPHVRYSRRDAGGAWSAPETVFIGKWGGGSPHIAANEAGVYLAWSDMACAAGNLPRLYYAVRAAGESVWQVSDVSTPGYTGFGKEPALILNGDKLTAAWDAYTGDNSPATLWVGESPAQALPGTATPGSSSVFLPQVLR